MFDKKRKNPKKGGRKVKRLLILAVFSIVAALLVQSLLILGGGNQLFDQVVKGMKSDFQAEDDAFVNRESRLIDVSKIKEGAFVIFDGKWVERNVNNLEFHEFLRDAVSKEIKLMAIGEHTSKFFEALHLAGVNELRRENGISRNPAYWDPPLVGYKLKSGEGYTYPSILVSNTRDVSELIEALRSW